MRPRFLVDENLAPAMGESVRRHNGAIDIRQVGDPDAPPLHTKDETVLTICEGDRRILVPKNRKSTPRHIADHLRAGNQFWGILSVKKGARKRHRQAR